MEIPKIDVHIIYGWWDSIKPASRKLLLDVESITIDLEVKELRTWFNIVPPPIYYMHIYLWYFHSSFM